MSCAGVLRPELLVFPDQPSFAEQPSRSCLEIDHYLLGTRLRFNHNMNMFGANVGSP